MGGLLSFFSVWKTILPLSFCKELDTSRDCREREKERSGFMSCFTTSLKILFCDLRCIPSFESRNETSHLLTSVLRLRDGILFLLCR